jgi:hypothetical protein
MSEQELEQNTTQPVELTIVDLQNIRSIIDVAARRGAFSAAEMSAIGSVYNKLDGFLNTVVPAKTEETTEENT